MKAFISGRILLSAVLLLPVVALAQTFPVRIERAGNNGVCDNMTASRMSVDPASGRVTLEGVTGMTCLPDGAAGLSTISVTVPAGPHASGVTGVTATVQGIPSGASCTLRGVVNTSGNGSVAGAGWADGTSLCTNCGTSVNRVLSLTNASTTAQWKFKLQVQCSLSSGGYAIQSPVIQSPEVTVEPSAVAVGNCPYGDQVPTDDHDGLTMASRQQTTTTDRDALGGTGVKSALLYTTLFGANAGGGQVGGVTMQSPGSVSEGYGHPGTHGSNFGFTLDRTKFIALQLRAPQVSATSWLGVVNTLKPFSASTNPGTVYTATVAPCPGQFRTTTLAPMRAACVMSAAGGTELGRLQTTFIAPGATYNGSLCPLELGKTYYLNIMAVDPAQPGSLNPANATANSLCVTNGTFCNARVQRLPLAHE